MAIPYDKLKSSPCCWTFFGTSSSYCLPISILSLLLIFRKLYTALLPLTNCWTSSSVYNFSLEMHSLNYGIIINWKKVSHNLLFTVTVLDDILRELAVGLLIKLLNLICSLHLGIVSHGISCDDFLRSFNTSCLVSEESMSIWKVMIPCFLNERKCFSDETPPFVLWWWRGEEKSVVKKARSVRISLSLFPN